jgi:RHS repeat-associated protein
VVDASGQVAATAEAAAVSVPAGQTGTLEGVVATPVGIPATSLLRVSVAVPTDAGASVSLTGEYSLQAADPAQPIVEVLPGALVLGALSPVRVRLYNRGSADMDVVTAQVVGSTYAAVDDVGVEIRTAEGTLLASGGLMQTGNGAQGAYVGDRQVFFVRVPPGESFLFDPVQMAVPNTAAGTLSVGASVSTPTYSLPYLPVAGARGFSSGSAQAVASYAAYTATSRPDQDLYDQGSSVTIRGTALDTYSGLPVPAAAVAVHVVSNGFERRISAVTDSIGTYSAVFFPLPNEAGLYTVWAAQPAVVAPSAQSSFTIVGLALQYSSFAATLAQNSTYTFTVRLTNIGASPVTGLSAEAQGGEGSGLSLTVDPVTLPATLAAGAYTDLKLALSASHAASSATLTWVVSESHGFQRSLPVAAAVVPAMVIPSVSPQQISLGMVGGDIRIVPLTIQNKGFSTWESVSVTDPSGALAWVSVLGHQGQTDLGDIPPGGNVNLTLQLAPPSGLANGTYSPSPLLQVLSSNMAPVAVSASVAVTSQRKGDVLLSIINADKPRDGNGQGVPVAGSKATLTSLDVAGLTFTVSADANGLAVFSQIPSGNYVWRAEAQGFHTVSGTAAIEPGMQNRIEAILPTATVSYRWKVTETTIQDQYNVVLQAEFKTDVPAPAIVVEPPMLKLEMAGGQTLYTQLTITNRGLISAKDYQLKISGDEAIQIKLPFSSIPEIRPGQSVSVPLQITLVHASCHGGTIRGFYCYYGYCGERVCGLAPDTGVSAGSCGGTGGDGYSGFMGGGIGSGYTLPIDYVAVAAPAASAAPACSSPVDQPDSRGSNDPGGSSPDAGSGDTRGGGGYCGAPHKSEDPASGQNTISEGGLDAGTPHVAVNPTHVSGPGGGGGSIDPTNPGTGVLPPSPGANGGHGWGMDFNPFIRLVLIPGQQPNFLHNDGRGGERLYVPLGPLDQPVNGGDGGGDVFAKPVYSAGTTLLRGGGVGNDACLAAERTAVPPTLDVRYKDGVTMTYRFSPCAGIALPVTEELTVEPQLGTYLLEKRTDANGNIVNYSRDGEGDLTRVADGFGHAIDISYNGQKQIASMSDQTSRSVSYTYDAAGDKTSYTDTNGDVTQYAYDAEHRITQITYPNGGHTYYTYHADGKVASTSEDSGANALNFVYSTSTNHSTVTDGLGRATAYEWAVNSGLRKMTKVTDPAGGEWNFQYNSNMDLILATDPLGRKSSFFYDKLSNMTAAMDAEGQYTLASYEATYSQVASVTDAKANKTNFYYDARGNLVQARDALGNSSQFAYDAKGLLISAKDPLGNVTGLGYDEHGAVSSVSDPLGRTDVMTRNSLGRLTKNTDPVGRQTDLSYDNEGNVLQVKDALNASPTVLGYEAGRVGRFPNALTDAKGQATSFSYDVLGRVTGVTNSVGQSMTATYDSMSRLESVTTRKNQSINLAYDTLDRLTQVTLPEGSITATYDAVGNVLSAGSYNGSGIGLTYDKIDRVKQVVQTLPNGFSATIGYTYDANGNRTGMSTPWGNFSYAYDALNRLTSITNPQGEVVSFTYDALGRRKTMTYPNGVVTSYAYDAASQVKQILHKKGDAALAMANYEYDANGNRTSMTDLDGMHTYGYDALNRLVSASHPPTSYVATKEEVFAYDAVGNRLWDTNIKSYQYNAANRLTENSSFTYTYDANGNQTEMVEKEGNKVTNLAFNSVNQLTRVDLPDGTRSSYKYDAAGRRVEKSTGSTSNPAVTRFVYDGQNILAALDGNNNLLALFTQGPGIDQPLIMRRPDGTKFFMLADALGSVVAHADESGAVVERVAYEAYGKPVFVDVRGPPVVASESLTGAPFAFTGRTWENETGLFDYRFRQLYDPYVGRFGQEDPIGVAGGDLNLFAFTLNNPVNYGDPLGLKIKYSGSFYNQLRIWWALMRLKFWSPTARAIISALENSPRTFDIAIIPPFGTGNSFDPNSLTIEYDLSLSGIPTPAGWYSRSPELGLMHELIHAYHWERGKFRRSDRMGEESRTVGLKPHEWNQSTNQVGLECGEGRRRAY